MRTSKPISTISYNSVPFLKSKLDELVRNHRISNWLFIQHHAEVDEKKDHIHLWIKPNTLLDSMDIQQFFEEYDPLRPDKPLGCIDFVSSQVDDFILYGLHLEAYLKSKFESREYHYLPSDFVYCDEDSFEDLLNHALRGSDWAKRNQLLQMLGSDNVSPVDLIMSGAVGLNMAPSLNALEKLKENHGYLDRGGRPGHDNQDDYVIVDDTTGEVVEDLLYDGLAPADDVDFTEDPHRHE